MPIEFFPVQLEPLVVDDDKSDLSQIEQKLKSARIFNPVLYDSYEPVQFIENARAADIVSLDLEVKRVKAPSLEVCRHLKLVNPEQSIIFFTSQPQEVLTEQINFVLDKSSEVWEAYDRLLMMILVHDRSLSLLRTVVDVTSGVNVATDTEQIIQLNKTVAPFISSVLSIQKFFRTKDRAASKRYRELTGLLKKIYMAEKNPDQAISSLRNIQAPLMEVVLTELHSIIEVKGAYATPKLENEIALLRDSVLHEHSEFAFVKRRMKRAVADASSRILNSLTDFGIRLVDVHEFPRITLVSDEEPEIEEIETDDDGNEEDVSDNEVKSDEDETDSETLFLNAWFPDHENDDSLTVGVAARLRVNLAYSQLNMDLGGSAGISEKEATLITASPYVDVMVVSANALVEPVLKRLETPVDEKKFVEFNVTPRNEGEVEFTIVLLVRNEPIFRNSFSCNAVEASTESEGGAE